MLPDRRRSASAASRQDRPCLNARQAFRARRCWYHLPPGRPLGVRLLGEDVVIWRAGGGQLLAWQDLCVHRGTRLSLGRISAETLEGPYHGWGYDTSGRCVRIPAHPGQAPPARACVQTYRVALAYGLVWVSLGAPAAPPPPFPEWADASYRK